MPNCNEATLASADKLIQLALDEDLQSAGDITSKATIDPAHTATVNIVSREAGILAGVKLISRIYGALCVREGRDSNAVVTELRISDGASVHPGALIASVSGPVQLLLAGERTALNFLIHLSGIASLTNQFVLKVQGSRAAILDTRKTLPGYRLLHKFAVKCGGGTNHRVGLFDGILIKDNHLAARGESSLADAVVAARSYLTVSRISTPIEIEVDTLEQLEDALRTSPDIVLLDNMPPAQLTQAVAIRDRTSPRTQLEASGGVNLETVGCIAGTGVDRISVGGLTHSARALDIGYDWPW